MAGRIAAFALAAALVTACGDAEQPPASVPVPTEAAASATPSPFVDDLGGFAPPDFEAGGLAINSKAKSLPAYPEPDPDTQPIAQLRSQNPAKQRLNFLVLTAMEDAEGTSWFEILLPERPNGSKGWVQLDDDIRIVYVDERIEVDLSEFELRYYRDGRLIERFEVGIGQDRYPTPVGAFYVWAHVPQPDPSGPYGNLALGLSGFSPVLSDWPGGGRSAIHGTADESDKSAKVSHGCVRVFNDDMKKLDHIRLGTPVLIRP